MGLKMKFKYKYLPLRTVKDFDKVDKLLLSGDWKVVSGGYFDYVLLEKEAVNGKANNQGHKRITQTKCSCR